MTAQDLLAAPPAGADVVVSAPGRANLIGEHTDYNQGFVLPVALDLRTVVAGTRTPDRLRITSLDLPEEGVVEVDLATGRGPRSGWGRYVTAVVTVLQDAGLELCGFDGVLQSDIPLGAGLSSSAALEVALAVALLPDPLDPVELARLCQRAENEGVGVQSGIMDQLASASSRAGCALLIDCRDLATEYVLLPTDLTVLVVDSRVQRSLSGSPYNQRRAECSQAAAALGVATLRDATVELVEQHWAGMEDVVRRRARHVVTENERVLALAAALRAGRTEEIGPLFAASHASLAEDFEVSIPELDLLVATAVATPGVLGSRMTGAGFGGCTVSLVQTPRAQDAADDICRRYAAASGRQPRAWVSPAAAGASYA